MLGLYSLFRHWVEHVLDDDRLALELDSFGKACKCIDIILDAKRRLTPMRGSGQALRRALNAYVEAHKRAYGTDNIKPKLHWMYDVADQLEGDERVWDAFVIERLHLRVKVVADRVDNTSSFEESVLAGYISLHRESLRGSLGFGLVGNSIELPEMPGVNIADELNLGGLRIARLDFVLALGSAGRVLACLEEAGSFYIVLRWLRKAQQLSPTSSRWAETAAHGLIRASSVEQCAAWYWPAQGGIIILEK